MGKILHLAKHNPGVQHRLGWTCLRSSSGERDLGVLVNKQLDVSEQCAVMAKKANEIIEINNGLHHQQRASPAEIKSSLSHSALVKPHLGSLCSALVPAMQKNPQNHGQAGEGPEKGQSDNQRPGKPDI